MPTNEIIAMATIINDNTNSDVTWILVGMTRRNSGTQILIGKERPSGRGRCGVRVDFRCGGGDGGEALVSGDDLALVGMHGGGSMQRAGTAVKKTRGTSPRN